MSDLTRVVVFRTSLFNGQESSAETTEFRHVMAKMTRACVIEIPETLRRLRHLGVVARQLQASLVDREGSAIDLEASLSNVGSALPEVRLHFANQRLTVSSPAAIYSLGLSHLVSVFDDGNEPRGWGFEDGSPVTTLNCRSSIWPALVHDVLIDISLFYSRMGPHRHHPTLTSRLRYSREKAQWLMERRGASTSTLYGPVLKKGEYPYLPLSVFSRADAGMALEALVSSWNAFLQHLRTSPPARSESSSHDDIVTYVTKFHPKGGQISRKRVMSLVSDLSPGEYALLRGERLPRDPRLKLTIAGTFNISPRSWHAGALKVIPWAESDNVLKHSRYISRFAFEVR